MNYADEFPEHSKTSCSDENPCNADPKGHWCWRCNAILFDRHTRLVNEAVARNARAEKWKQIAINLHDHRDFVRNLDRAGMEEAIRATARYSPHLAALYTAMLEEMP